MPRRSDALPRAPARRPRPERRRHRSPGRPSERSGALFFALITSPHNDSLTQVRKLAGRKWRDKLGEFVAEGEDLLDAADAAGWPPVLRLCEAGSRLAGEEGAAPLLAKVSQLRSGSPAPAPLAPRRGRQPAGAPCGRPR